MNFQGTTSTVYPERLGDTNSSPAVEEPPRWSQQPHHQKPPPSHRYLHSDDNSVCVSVSSWAALDPLYSPPRPSYASPPSTRGRMPVMPRNEGPLVIKDDVSIATLNSWAGIDTDQAKISPAKSRLATSDSAIRYGRRSSGFVVPQSRTNLRIPRPRAECEAPQPPPVPLPRRRRSMESAATAPTPVPASESSWGNAEVDVNVVKTLAVSLAKDALMPAAHIPMVRRKSYVSCSTKSSGKSTKRRSNANASSAPPRGMDTMKIPPLPVPRGANKLSSWITGGRSSSKTAAAHRPPQPHVDPY